MCSSDLKKDLTACTIAGKVYGIKMIDDTGALYMRKSVLEKAGVKAPTTFDELVAAAKTLTAGKQKGLFLGNDGGVSALVTLGLQSAGGTLIDESGPKFNTEHTIFAWEQIAKLNKEGSLLIGAPTDWWDPSAFVQGLTAMQWGGLWAYPEINKQLKDDFIVAPFPEFKGVAGAKSTPVTFWGGWSQLANGQSKSLDAAKALIKWMWIDNTKIQTDWALAYGFHVPPRLSVAKTAEPLKEGRTKQIVDDMYKYGQANPPIWTTAMGTAVTNGLSNVVKSGKSAKEEVAAALKICETEFAAQK